MRRQTSNTGRQRTGSTLLEMVIGVTILAILAQMLIGASTASSTMTEIGNIEGEVFRQSERAMSRILGDLRSSGFVEVDGRDEIRNVISVDLGTAPDSAVLDTAFDATTTIEVAEYKVARPIMTVTDDDNMFFGGTNGDKVVAVKSLDAGADFVVESVGVANEAVITLQSGDNAGVEVRAAPRRQRHLRRHSGVRPLDSDSVDLPLPAVTDAGAPLQQQLVVPLHDGRRVEALQRLAHELAAQPVKQGERVGQSVKVDRRGRRSRAGVEAAAERAKAELQSRGDVCTAHAQHNLARVLAVGQEAERVLDSVDNVELVNRQAVDHLG